jgi:hypothetical protein
MERSFARAKRFGFDRARWRGLWRMQIQEYLICAIQNIQVLVNRGYFPKKSAAASLRATNTAISKSFGLISLINNVVRDSNREKLVNSLTGGQLRQYCE